MSTTHLTQTRLVAGHKLTRTVSSVLANEGLYEFRVVIDKMTLPVLDNLTLSQAAALVDDFCGWETVQTDYRVESVKLITALRSLPLR